MTTRWKTRFTRPNPLFSVSTLRILTGEDARHSTLDQQTPNNSEHQVLLQLTSELRDGAGVVEVGEVGVAGEGFAVAALDENLYTQNVRDIRGQRLNHRGYRELFFENPGAVSVGEDSVHVDDRDARRDQINCAQIGSQWQRVRRILGKVDFQEGPQHFFCTLLARRGKCNIDSLHAQDSRVIVGNVERYRFGGARGRGRYRTRVSASFHVGHTSAHAASIDAEREHCDQHDSTGENQMTGDHLAAPNRSRTETMPLASALTTFCWYAGRLRSFASVVGGATSTAIAAAETLFNGRRGAARVRTWI